MATSQPDFRHEEREHRRGNRPVAGVDEAGRGPLAGPVVAAAVILDPNHIPEGLNDSKVLKTGRRAVLFDTIVATSEVGVGIADVARIERDNILLATLWAMAEGVAALARRPAMVLVDGNRCPELDCPATPVVKGDARVLSIAAASIIAKVTRDRIMADLALQFPGYGWERNMGYGTAEHRAALARLGVTPHHRRTFAPVRAVLEAGSGQDFAPIGRQ